MKNATLVAAVTCFMVGVGLRVMCPETAPESSGIPKKVVTTVEDKKFVPACPPTNDFFLVGNIPLVLGEGRPASYLVYFTIENMRMETRVGKKVFEKTKIGDHFEVEYLINERTGVYTLLKFNFI